MISLLVLACIATTAIAVAFVLCWRKTEPDRPCVYCGTMLKPPLYECDHYLGGGSEIRWDSAPTWRSERADARTDRASRREARRRADIARGMPGQ
jgi:hypothetical protein